MSSKTMNEHHSGVSFPASSCSQQNETISNSKVPLKVLVIAAFAVWGLLIFVGHFVLFEYEFTAGPLTNSKRIFPATSAVQLAHGRQNVVLFLHPVCPCSVSSVGEFRRLLKEKGAEAVGTVVAYMPQEKVTEWSLEPVFTTLRRIPNVNIVFDSDGAEQKKFDAATSGHVFIYDGRGVLQFSGGLTGSRGHAGDNANYQTAKHTLLAKNPKFATAPVFGCALGSN